MPHPGSGASSLFLGSSSPSAPPTARKVGWFASGYGGCRQGQKVGSLYCMVDIHVRPRRKPCRVPGLHGSLTGRLTMTTRMAALDATDNTVIRSSRCRIRFDSHRQARTGMDLPGPPAFLWHALRVDHETRYRLWPAHRPSVRWGTIRRPHPAPVRQPARRPWNTRFYGRTKRPSCSQVRLAYRGSVSDASDW